MNEQATTQTQGQPGTTAVAAPPPAPPRAGGARRLYLINGLALLVIIIIAAVVYYLWHQSYYFYSTDDATVSAPTAQAAPLTAGTIARIYHAQGSQIHKGDHVAYLRTPSGAVAFADSPLNGTIVQESAAPGDVVAAGQPLAQIADLSAPSITAYVEETHIKDVHPGQGVDVTVDAVSGVTFQGRVGQILPTSAAALSSVPSTDYASGNFTKVTQRIPVVITLDGTQGHTLYPGTSAEVTIHIHS